MLIPRYYQEEANVALWDFFKKNPVGNPLICMPTGTGKAFSICYFIKTVLEKYSNQRSIVATHVKELVEQNYLEFKGLCPNINAGIFSAGLNRKDRFNKVIFGGIQSMVNCVQEFGKINLLIVDECDLISPDDDTNYQIFIRQLMLINPKLRVIGFTATPWRLGQGHLTEEGGIFTHVAFDITGMEAFNKLIEEGFLCPLVPKKTDLLLDVTGVKKNGKDYIEKSLQEAVDKDVITRQALNETIELASDRHCWLVFAAGVNHAINITKMLNEMGISACVVHSKLTKTQRDNNILDWKAGKFKAIVNNGILTTGLNHKPVDLIVMLRPTLSSRLWVQMLGRGTRPYNWITEINRVLAQAFQYIKNNCLVLDFAGNTASLGPINDPKIPKKRGEPTGEIPIKICPHEGCNTYNHISARFCGGKSNRDADGNKIEVLEGCGEPFIFQTQIQANASVTELIKKSDAPIMKDIKIDRITFNPHNLRKTSGQCLKVTYWSGPHKFDEYIMFEGAWGSGLRRSKDFWEKRTMIPYPSTTAEAVLHLEQLETPSHIRVWMNPPEKHPKVLNWTFDGNFEKLKEGEVPF